MNRDQQEDELAEELKQNCDENNNEIDLNKSAEIFCKLAKIYQKRKPDDIKDRMVCLIKSAALFNAAILRSSDNAKQFKEDLKDFCEKLLLEAGAENKDADLVQESESVARSIKYMRDSVRTNLGKLKNIPDDVCPADQTVLEVGISTDVEELQNSLAFNYTNIMADVAKFAEHVMGEPPCEFSLAGMGSLARKEITPYSDFENMILLESTGNEYENMLNYFRWYSVIFQVVLINLGETIIPSVSISVLNDKNSKNGDWFYDKITPRGICFDGMMPHACKFPLGRTQPTKDKPWKTELIKPVNEMLKYLNCDESLKNGYHLGTILTKACHVYGNVRVFEEFENGVRELIELEPTENVQRSVKKQITEDLAKFATRQSLVGVYTTKHFNVKQVVYRSTTILISEMGRFYKLSANSCFDILRELAVRKYISETTKQKLMFAIALACQVRLKWYMLQNKQDDNMDSMALFSSLVGKPATLSYFRIAYALQCDISKRFNLKKLHLYSNPKLLNVSLAHCLEDYEPMHNFTQDSEQKEISRQRYYEFDECLAALEERILSNRDLHLKADLCDDINNIGPNYFLILGDMFQRLQCYDDAIECYERWLSMIDHKHLKMQSLAAELRPTDSAILHSIGDVKHCIGSCLLNLCKREDAKASFESSLHIRSYLSYGINVDCHISRSLYQIGICLTFMHSLDEALVYLEASLLIRKNISNDVTIDLSVANAVFALGRCFMKKRESSKALSYLLEALQITEKHSHLDSKVNRDVARMFESIGHCFQRMFKYELALYCFEKASVNIARTSSSVSTDRDFAYASFIKGHCLINMKQPKEAQLVFARTLLIEEKLSLNITVDRNIAATCYWIGRCFLDMNELEKSKAFFHRALMVYDKTSVDNTNDQDIASTSYWIGRCLMRMAKPVESLKFLNRALLIRTKISCEVTSDREVANTNCCIGLCLMDLKKLLEAKFYFSKTLKVYEKSSLNATTDLDIAKTYEWIARCLMGMDQPQEAQAFLEKAELIREKISPNPSIDYNVAEIKYWIGYCLGERNRAYEAQVFFDKALEIVENRFAGRWNCYW